MSDVRKKPVNPVLHKKTPYDEIRETRKLTHSVVSLPDAIQQPLPTEPASRKFKVVKDTRLLDAAKRRTKPANQKLIHRLKVVQAQLPVAKADCASCSSSPCCYRYPTFLTPEEYRTGLYGDNAIELTPEILDQFRHVTHLYIYLPYLAYFYGSPASYSHFVLKKREDGGCVYLDKHNKCSIYSQRPLSCRLYTCDGDPAITQEMKDGSDPTFAIVE